MLFWLNKLLYEYWITQRDGSYQNFSSQAKSINLHNNLRTKVMTCCANIYLNRQCLIKKGIPNYVVLWLNKLLYEYWITQRDGSYQNVNFSDQNRDGKLNDGRQKFYIMIFDSVCRPCILTHKVCMLRSYAGLGYAECLTHGVNRQTATLDVCHMTSIVRRPLLASDRHVASIFRRPLLASDTWR